MSDLFVGACPTFSESRKQKAVGSVKNKEGKCLETVMKCLIVQKIQLKRRFVVYIRGLVL